MLIFLELRTFKDKNLDKTYLSNILLGWENQNKSKGRFYALCPLIFWLKIDISDQDRVIVTLMYELSLPDPDRVHCLNTFLLYIYSVLFPLLICAQDPLNHQASTWYEIFKMFNLSFSPNIPFYLSHLSWESLPQTSEFPWVQSFLWLQRALGS